MNRNYKKLITQIDIEQPNVHLWRAIIFAAFASLLLFAAFFAINPKVISVSAERATADTQLDFEGANDYVNDYVLARADGEGNVDELAEAYEPGNVMELARADGEGNVDELAEAYGRGNVIELARADGEGNVDELARTVGYKDLLAA